MMKNGRKEIKTDVIKKNGNIIARCLVILGMAGVLTGCHGSKGMQSFEIPVEFDESKEYEITFWAKNDTNKTQTAVYEKAIEDFEKLYPNTKAWETCTPYFEKRNIHFYVNICGFHITEFFHEKHPMPDTPEDFIGDGNEGMFAFRKVM